MAVARLIQLLWAIFFAVTMGIGGLARGTTTGLVFSAIAFGYLAATIGCSLDYRVCWLIAIIFPIMPLSHYIPMVFVNLDAFYAGDELYSDSPMTMAIVAVNVVLFVFPGLMIYLFLFLDRARFWSVLRPSGTIRRTGRD